MSRPAVLLVVGLLGLGAPAAAQEPPVPHFDGIDHARPEEHLGASPHVGAAARLEAIARQLVGPTGEATLANIGRWLDRNLRSNPSEGLRWRTLDEMLEDRTVGSCADRATAFGALARAAGIPTVWVKTMDVDWIRSFQAGDASARTYRGHVFLEMHLDGAWRLLDADAMRLWREYDPTSRILPGNRYAYDKGDDPYDLVLSSRWDLWKAQTDAYFAALDPALLPWGGSDDLLAPWRLDVVGQGPRAQAVVEAGRRLGFYPRNVFNHRFEVWLPRVAGGVLVVLTEGGRPLLPEATWDAWLPPVARDLAAGGAPPAQGWAARRLEDGTRVVLVTTTDETVLTTAVAQALRAEGR